jgi:hypothetical protein
MCLVRPGPKPVTGFALQIRDGAGGRLYTQVMLAIVAVLVLAQPPPSERPISLASVGFSAVKVNPALATSFEQTFALRLVGEGLRVTTQRDLAAVLGVERQKALLGCSDQSNSCLAELAGAIGADGIIQGEVALVGKVFQLTIKVLSPRDGQPLYLALRRFTSEEDALTVLDAVAIEAAAKLRVALPRTPVAASVDAVATPTPAFERPARVGPVVMLVAGAVVLVAGAVVQGLAVADYTTLRDAPGLSAARGSVLVTRGSTEQVVGLSVIGAGAAVGLAGLIWFLLPAAPPISAWVGPQGGGLVFSGAW